MFLHTMLTKYRIKGELKMWNGARVVVVVMVVVAASFAHADDGTATFYTPPYVREYWLILIWNNSKSCFIKNYLMWFKTGKLSLIVPWVLERRSDDRGGEWRDLEQQSSVRQKI